MNLSELTSIPPEIIRKPMVISGGTEFQVLMISGRIEVN